MLTLDETEYLISFLVQYSKDTDIFTEKLGPKNAGPFGPRLASEVAHSFNELTYGLNKYAKYIHQFQDENESC